MREPLNNASAAAAAAAAALRLFNFVLVLLKDDLPLCFRLFFSSTASDLLSILS